MSNKAKFVVYKLHGIKGLWTYDYYNSRGLYHPWDRPNLHVRKTAKGIGFWPTRTMVLSIIHSFQARSIKYKTVQIVLKK